MLLLTAVAAGVGVIATVLPAGAAGDTLGSGGYLKAGSSLVASNSCFRFIMQGDGNAVVYTKSGQALWATGTDGHPGARIVMQTDGNLVVIAGNTPVWASGTDGHPGSRLVMQNDGNLVIYVGSTATWASRSGPRGCSTTYCTPGSEASPNQSVTFNYGWLGVEGVKYSMKYYVCWNGSTVSKAVIAPNASPSISPAGYLAGIVNAVVLRGPVKRYYTYNGHANGGYLCYVTLEFTNYLGIHKDVGANLFLHYDGTLYQGSAISV